MITMNFKLEQALAMVFIIAPPLASTNHLLASSPSYYPPAQTLVAQGNQAEMAYAQMDQSMTNAMGEIVPFLTLLSEMENVQTDEQLLALAQQLYPMANRITNNFSQAYQAGEVLLPMLPAGSMETQYLSTVVAINGLGSLAFSPWQEILGQIQQAYQAENTAILQAAIAKVPPAINKLAEFGGQLQSVFQQGQQIQASQASASSNMSPEYYQRMSDIYRMGHETSMGILNNIRSDGEWHYNYSTGRDEYQYY
ncbi:slr1869 [Synechocystis sp. PCC 6803]|uniref:Slr1869 protein n=2 Tax=Synechocystis TaxID=1142 RepID=P73621_SYNY3|nr:hypothetical protein MYO_111000 [Synechocystis sp. PCC 6803]AVP89209.1 hypothetical protein C7I86_05655 [Synechocystis sp. IPPAS B-1465]MBD2617595.1 hypothetical protein [Synechocystis sp. FACHB-898]MBD2638954.1 hypothetical protein [Synechocystis sp. FACHB-908]MBD2660201.1 hypothetical protein [Synechocystis sp. FACHB-929]BAL28837.1 hypothetical protein SYNGTI_1090 [Synechocystis sp. PCC 6803 substr. GT-I]BAL32006.1 hypothetical protein SYNPCCN_1089 [Synechocystis sp. PCC 6803 substr. PCC